MSDRIQFRRDTAARWAQFNPFLLEGEIGVVLDNPNQYKVGDGVHYWNDLPLRGFNGNIVNQKGQSEESVMSQKAVTDAINSNTAYLYCTSNAGDDKVVQNTGFDINNGIRLLIKMQYANTKVSDVTLQVGTTDAKPIIYNGAAVTDENTWDADEVLDVYYNGSNYIATPHLNVDDEPTAGSDNLVKSGGVEKYENETLGLAIPSNFELGSLTASGNNYASTTAVRTLSHIPCNSSTLLIKGDILLAQSIVSGTTRFLIKLLGYDENKNCLGVVTGWKELSGEFSSYSVPSNTKYVRVLLTFYNNSTNIDLTNYVAGINAIKYGIFNILITSGAIIPSILETLETNVTFGSGEKVKNTEITGNLDKDGKLPINNSVVSLGESLLNNSLSYSDLRKIQSVYSQGSYNDSGQVVTDNKCVVSNLILSNFTKLYVDVKEGYHYKLIQFNNGAVVSSLGWNTRKEIDIIGDSFRIAIHKINDTDFNVGEYVLNSPISFYYITSGNPIRTSRELDNILSNRIIEDVFPITNNIGQGSLTNYNTVYFSLNAIHLNEPIEVIPYTDYYVKINDGYRYKVLRSDDGTASSGDSGWRTDHIYNPGSSKYLKFVFDKPGLTNLSPFDFYQVGFIFSKSPSILASKRSLLEYTNTLGLSKQSISPVLGNFKYSTAEGFVASTKHLSIIQPIEVDRFFEYKIESQSSIIVTFILFDKNKDYVDTLYYRPISESFAVDKSVKYVSIQMQKSDTTDITTSDISLIFNTYRYNDNLENIKTYGTKKHAQTYYGEKISLGSEYDRDIYIKEINYYSGKTRQSCVYYNDLLYIFHDSGWCVIYNTITKTFVREFWLNGESAIEGLHCNSATLVKTDANGIYVCLSAYYTPEAYIYYITSNSCTLISTINVTGIGDVSNVLFNLNGDKVYVISNFNNDSTHTLLSVFNYKFSSVDSLITLDSTNLDSSHNISYIQYFQDGFICGNRLYLLSGTYDPIKIQAFSLSDFNITSEIDLSTWKTEPEGLTQFGNDMLMVYLSNNNVFRLIFD